MTHQYQLLTAGQYAILWLVTGVLMLVQSVGALLGWRDLLTPLYWVALVGLLSLCAASTYEYYHRVKAQ